MLVKKLALAALAAMGITVVLVSTALALDVDLPVVGSSDAPSLGALQSVSDLETLHKPFAANATQKAELAKLADDTPAESAARRLDVSKARPTDVAGKTVWIAPTTDGQLCVFVPANGGFNVACGTAETIRTTGLVSVSSGSDGKAIAVIVGPNGAPDAVARSRSGSTRTIKYAGNVAATELHPGETLDTGSVSVPAPPAIPAN